MEFRNLTSLDGVRLRNMVVRHTVPHAYGRLKLTVRYSRSADFSGTCFYREGRIFVNIGRHVCYPYRLATHVAKARSNRTHWWRETYYIVVADAYQLALFVYLHELYHLLVRLAGRSPRCKESRCDRFAARVLVDHYGCSITDSRGRAVSREQWDFEDLERLVAPVRGRRAGRRPAPTAVPTGQVPVRILGLGSRADSGSGPND